MSLAQRAANASGKTELITPLTGVMLEAPRLNLNGSSKQSLLDGYVSAIAALQEAQKTMQECMPHGRDYQTSPAGSYETARDQHLTRLQMLAKCLAEMEEIALNVQGQGGR